MQVTRDGARSPSMWGVELACFVPILPLMPTVKWWWGHWWVPICFCVLPIFVTATANVIFRKPVAWFFWRAFHALRGPVLYACPWWVRRNFHSRTK